VKFTSFPNLKSYKGNDISFDELISKIREGSDPVIEARLAGKPSTRYEEIKATRVEAFQPNVRNFLRSRDTRYNTDSTGFIFLDIDNLPTSAEASAFKISICAKFNFISACWLSLSGCGLSLLVRVTKCNRNLFDGYWDKLNELFEGRIDSRTRSYDQLCCISFDHDVFVNHESIAFDSLYKVGYRGLRFKEFLPEPEFADVNSPVVSREGRAIVELNLSKYQPFRGPDGMMRRSNGIPVGKRNATIGLISMLLIYLNPQADRSQLLNAVLSLSRYYSIVPLSYNEVVRIFNSNFKKLSKLSRTEFSLMLEKYKVKRYVFFHPHCTLTKNEKLSVIQKEINFIKGKGKAYTEALLEAAIASLQDGTPITRKRLMEFTSLSESTIKRYWKPLKVFIDNYNNEIDQNSKGGSVADNTLRGSNISTSEPRGLPFER
jgi:hypothetical protein